MNSAERTGLGDGRWMASQRRFAVTENGVEVTESRAGGASSILCSDNSTCEFGVSAGIMHVQCSAGIKRFNRCVCAGGASRGKEAKERVAGDTCVVPNVVRE